MRKLKETIIVLLILAAIIIFWWFAYQYGLSQRTF